MSALLVQTSRARVRDRAAWLPHRPPTGALSAGGHIHLLELTAVGTRTAGFAVDFFDEA